MGKVKGKTSKHLSLQGVNTSAHIQSHGRNEAAVLTEV